VDRTDRNDDYASLTMMDIPLALIPITDKITMTLTLPYYSPFR